MSYHYFNNVTGEKVIKEERIYDFDFNCDKYADDKLIIFRFVTKKGTSTILEGYEELLHNKATSVFEKHGAKLLESVIRFRDLYAFFLCKMEWELARDFNIPIIKAGATIKNEIAQDLLNEATELKEFCNKSIWRMNWGYKATGNFSGEHKREEADCHGGNSKEEEELADKIIKYKEERKANVISQ